MGKIILGRRKISFFVFLVVCLLTFSAILFAVPGTAQAATADKVVIIDPGHNVYNSKGFDCGAVAPDKTTEASLNMQLAPKIARALVGRGYTVFSTIPMAAAPEIPYLLSTTCSLSDRAYQSVVKGANLFISVHHNSAGGSTWSTASGACVLYDSAQAAAPLARSKALAGLVANSVRSLPYMQGNRASGVIDQAVNGGATVLRNNMAPAVTLEAGFITNQTDLANAKDGTKQSEVAGKVAEAVDSFLAQYPNKMDYKAPTASSVIASAAQTYGKTFQANAMGLQDESGVAKVEFAVWSKADQSDLVWYNGVDFKNTNWGTTIDASRHNNNRGVYNIHAYAADIYGNRGFVGSTTVNMLTDANAPTAASVASPVSQTWGKTFQVNAMGLKDSESGVANVRFAVWSKADQSDLAWYNGVDFKNTNWGITVDTANHHNNTGTYNIHAYAANGQGKTGFIGATTVKVLYDGTPPTAKSVSPSASQTYANTFQVNAFGLSDDLSGVANVRFAVWSKADQSDFAWYNGVDFKNTNWGVTVNTANHKNNTGTYNIHVYATDGKGNTGFVGATNVKVLEDNPPTATSVVPSVSQTWSSTFQVNAMHVADNETGVASVRFAVWSKADNSDLVWYNGVDFKNSNWGITVNTANHKNNRGLYNIHVYAKNGQGKEGFVGATTVNLLTDTKAPTASSITKSYISGKDTFTATANGVTDDLTGVAKVEFAVWTKSNQSDMKWINGTQSGSNWSISDNIENHGNLDGVYNVHVYATDGFGNRGFIGSTAIQVQVDRSGPKANYIAANASSVETTFSVAAYGVSDSVSITGVQFAVWSKADQSDLKWYEGVDYKNTNWGISVNYKNHNYNKGTYNIHVYAANKLGIRTFVGYTTVNVTGSTALPTMDRIEISPNPATTAFAATMYNVDSGSGITKVECAVWSELNGQDDLKWYNAISYNNGNYYINVDYSSHKQSTGVYNIHVYATDNSGNRVFVGSNTVQVDGVYGIMGASTTTANQLVNYYISKVGLAAYPAYYSQRGMNLNQFAEMYMLEASYEGVKAEVAWAQMCNETNFLRFTGDVCLEQFNFAGLGATGGGVPGFNFAAKYGDDFWGIIAGIRGQIQHLKCYASTAALANLNGYGEPYDPRWWSALRGTAPTVESLSGRWASSTTYGSDLMIIINGIKSSSGAYVPMGEVAIQAVTDDTALAEPEPTPAPSPTETPAPAVTPQPSPSATPEPSASASPEPSASASPEASETTSPEPTEDLDAAS